MSTTHDDDTPDLFDDPVVADNDDRHPAKQGFFRSTDDQGIDIKSTSGKHARDVSQNTGFVFD